MPKVELNFFNVNNTFKEKKEPKKSDPMIACTVASGVMRINLSASEKLSLTEDSKIEFVNTTEEPDKFFLFFSDEGFPLKRVPKLTPGFALMSSALSKKMGKAIGVAKSFKMKVADQTIKLQGHELWPLELVDKK